MSAHEWRACRSFLANLEVYASGGSSGVRAGNGNVPHADRCAACAARLRSARTQVELLRGLPRPVVPEALGSPEFLTGIYERAGAAAESRVGPALSRALTGESAPMDADWLAAEDAGGMAESLARSLPTGRPPGWLWVRIQTEVRSLINIRRRSRRMRRIQFVGLLAASLLISAVALWSFMPNGFSTTPKVTADQIRFQSVTSPLASALGASGLGASGSGIGGSFEIVETIRQVGEER